MSNTVVGGVYQSIIEEVINTSRVDFEENGVEESVLDDLCQGWKRKLTQFNVAQFPWDPKPDATDQLVAPSNSAGSGMNGPPGILTSPGIAASKVGGGVGGGGGGYAQPTMSPMSGGQGLTMPLSMPSMDQGDVKNDMNSAVKMEPDLHNGPGMNGVPAASHAGGPAMPSYPSIPMGGGPAAARAMQQLQNTFGQRAAASINAIHSGMHQGNPQQQGRGMGPGGMPHQQHPQHPQHPQHQQQQHQQQQHQQQQQQYRMQMNAAQAAQAAHAAHMNGSNGVGRSQMDGADDGALFEGVLMQQQAAGQATVELGRVEIDNMLHEQIALRAKQMEGGGLMLSLKEATKHTRRAAAVSKRAAAGAMGQVDGLDDDDDTKDGVVADEDAINSDLDDPDDEHEDDDDEDDVLGPIMLCVYDKVQRVKNKWKCTLKDGVLTVNGKEYVFHKATGEYEW